MWSRSLSSKPRTPPPPAPSSRILPKPPADPLHSAPRCWNGEDRPSVHSVSATLPALDSARVGYRKWRHDAGRGVLPRVCRKGASVPGCGREGDPVAQHDLGIAYCPGRGVPQDFIRAHSLFDLAASTLTAGARRDLVAETRVAVAARTTLAHVAEAQRLAAREPAAGRDSASERISAHGEPCRLARTGSVRGAEQPPGRSDRRGIQASGSQRRLPSA